MNQKRNVLENKTKNWQTQIKTAKQENKIKELKNYYLLDEKIL